MVHYELIVFYCLGNKPRDAIRVLRVSRSSAYRMYRHYRRALKQLSLDQKTFSDKMYRLLDKKVPEVLYVPFVVSPRR